MSMNINGFGAGSNYSYKNTDTKSKQYKAAAKDHLAAFMEKTQNLFAKTLKSHAAELLNVSDIVNKRKSIASHGILLFFLIYFRLSCFRSRSSR